MKVRKQSFQKKNDEQKIGKSERKIFSRRKKNPEQKLLSSKEKLETKEKKNRHSNRLFGWWEEFNPGWVESLFRVFGWRAAGDGADPQGNIRTRCGFAPSAKIGRT